MVNPLYKLRRFYQPGRTEHGGWMGEDEEVDNATYRAMSTFEDGELEQLIAGATKFIAMAQETINERAVEC